MAPIEKQSFQLKCLLAMLLFLIGNAQMYAVERPPAFNAARLRSVHVELLATYAAERKKFSESPVTTLPYSKWPIALPDFYLHLAKVLEDAGVRTLLNQSEVERLPAAVRAEILNDYGFWLSKTKDPKKAIPVLQKAVEIAPTRAIAELNLANAVHSSLTLAVTWEHKTTLAKIGLQAYSSYQTLTAKRLPAAEEFESLYASANASSDVCSYVAAFYNLGRQDELWGYPDPVEIAGDGKLRHVYIFDEGTAHIPVIFSSLKEIPEEDRLAESFNKDEVKFERTDLTGSEEAGSWPALHMMPFRDGYYLVYQDDVGPVAVVKPNMGTVCRIKRSFTSTLTEDRTPATCRDVIAGKAFDKISDVPLPREKIHVDDLLVSLPGGPPHFTRYSDVKLDPDGALGRIGYFEFQSGAGPGCDFYGIAFIEGDHLEQSARASALTGVQDRLMDCRGSNAFLVQAYGENLVEWNGGRALQRPTPPRTLFRLRRDKIETVCRVEQRPTYSPEMITH